MFKGIYNVSFAGLQFSAVKITPMVSKNRGVLRMVQMVINQYCDIGGGGVYLWKIFVS